MLGFSRRLKNNQTVSYEFLQIREDENGLFYMPQPEGGQRVSFKLARFNDGQYTFENRTHDFPRRIIYEQQGAMMLTRIEGTLKGQPQREEFLKRRVRCNEPTN